MEMLEYRKAPLNFWTVKVIKYQNCLVRQVVELPNIAGDIPNPAGFGPGNPAAADAALSRRLGLDNPRWCFPTAKPRDAEMLM